MLIAEQVAPYDDPDSIYELKLDGIRCIAYCDEHSVDLRNKRDIKLIPRFPELENINQNCKVKCILDGELNVLTNGKPDFYNVQKRTILSDPFKIQLASARYPANYVAYDVLYYKNKLITSLPLMERKKILKEIIFESNILSISRYIEKSGIALFNAAKQQNLEGIVGKKKDSLYWFGKKTHEWKKIKVMADKDFVAVGYIPKANHMTSLILALYDDDNNLVVTNHVTLGVSIAKLKPYGMKLADCPVDIIPKGNENATWIEPMVCTVEYMPSETGGMRQAVFKTIRDDKIPIECRIKGE